MFPESPILLSIPSGNLFTKSQALAIFKQSINSSSEAFGLAIKRLFFMESLNKIESCVTNPINSLSDSFFNFLMLFPSILIDPESTS